MNLELNDVKELAVKYMGSPEMGKAYLLGYIWATLSDGQKLETYKALTKYLEEKN
jgi:hypothetical protein